MVVLDYFNNYSSLATFILVPFLFSTIWMAKYSSGNSIFPSNINVVTPLNYHFKLEETERLWDSRSSRDREQVNDESS